MPIPHGRAPTSSIVRVTLSVATSITEIDLARPLETYRVWPSGDITAPMGRGGTGAPAGRGRAIVVVTLCVLTSNTVTTPLFSAVTNASAPSRVNAMSRGRAPV